MALSVSNAQNILKKTYASYRSLNENFFENSPTFLQIPKAQWGGDDLGFRIKTSHSNTGSKDYNTSYQAAVANAVKVAAFATDTDKYYTSWQIEDTIFWKAKTKGAFISSTELEITDARQQLEEKRSRDVFLSGYGELGRLPSSGSNVDSTNKTITVADLGTLKNFFEGMTIVAAPSLGGTQRTGELVVSAIDEDAMKITYTTNTITALANNDYLFKKGDYNASERSYMVGLGGWVPTATELAAETSFFGHNRKTGARSRVAGFWFGDKGSALFKDYFGANLAKMKALGGKINRVVMNPEDQADWIKELGLDVNYYQQPVQYANRLGAQAGFNYIEVKSPWGNLKVYSDEWCPKGRWWGFLKEKSFRIRHLGPSIIMPWRLGFGPKEVGFPIVDQPRFGGAFASYAMLQCPWPINTCTGTV